MNEITIDTIKMDEIGKDIVAKTNELVTIYQNALNLLYSIRAEGSWSGISADAFFKKLDMDNKRYINYFNSFSKFGTSFSNVSQRYENLAKKYRVSK